MPQFAHAPDGTPIAYDTVGEGPDILLIHGFASDRFQNWRDPGWYKTLTEAGYRVTAFDFRGHGESGKPHEAESYGLRMLTDTVAVMDAAGIGQARVMGYSMGAWQAVVLMLHYPERVSRAVLGGVGEHYFKGAVAGAVKDALMADDVARLSDPTAIQFFKFLHRPGKDPIALRACVQGVRPAFSCAELGRITQPILVVDGERDDVAGRPGPFAECFPHSRSLILPAKDHMSAVGDKLHKQAAVEFFAGSN